MRRTLLLIILLLFELSANSQVLYTINGRGLKGESYLLFVDDMLPTSTLLDTKDVFRCYNRADVVICEYNEEVSWEKMQKFLLDEKVTLSMTMPYTEIGMVDSVLKADSKVSLSKVEQLKPAAVRMIWQEEVCRSLYQRGDDDMPMDSYFQQVAILEGKKVVALDDTVTYDYLSEDIDLQARGMIVEFRNGRDSVVKRYDTADSLFRRGDIQALSSLQMRGKTVEAIEAKVDGWIGKIINAMSADRCFIVLNARYYNGGIISKLKKQGYKIKEVK